MKIGIVGSRTFNNDESLWEYQKEAIEEEFPKARVKFFPNAGYAARETGSPDFILIDVGAMMSLGCDVVSLTKCNVEGLADLHPGAIFIINSAISVYAKDVYDELKTEIKAVSRWCDGCNTNNEIFDAIKEYLKHG